MCGGVGIHGLTGRVFVSVFLALKYASPRASAASMLTHAGDGIQTENGFRQKMGVISNEERNLLFPPVQQSRFLTR
jgi:hypothetical protein